MATKAPAWNERANHFVVLVAYMLQRGTSGLRGTATESAIELVDGMCPLHSIR
jgi:hypothetical protein